MRGRETSQLPSHTSWKRKKNYGNNTNSFSGESSGVCRVYFCTFFHVLSVLTNSRHMLIEFLVTPSPKDTSVDFANTLSDLKFLDQDISRVRVLVSL
jgi:hypothetical protein